MDSIQSDISPCPAVLLYTAVLDDHVTGRAAVMELDRRLSGASSAGSAIVTSPAMEDHSQRHLNCGAYEDDGDDSNTHASFLNSSTHQHDEQDTMSMSTSTMPPLTPHQQKLDRRTIAKLDSILLPLLSLLFLLNHLDKSNVGNAEAAHFTQDLGLPPEALNKSVACFWAVFVALQPLGAALGRKYGMTRWVPACMALWGVCTALHVAVRHEWQLISLRILVAILESSFYPTTVSYLSLFYTRYEFARRLGIFYGQSALAGAMGGLLSWAVFKQFPTQPSAPDTPSAVRHIASKTHWKSWEILFMIEGLCTVFVALLAFFWLPHSAGSAWFFTSEEAEWAEARVRYDQNISSVWHPHSKLSHEGDHEPPQGRAESPSTLSRVSTTHDEEEDERLLSNFQPGRSRHRKRANSTMSSKSLTADAGLSRLDVSSAMLDWKVWFLLACNVLSAIPTTAFAVFLPLVIKGLTADDEGMAPATANLLAIPPFLGGAAALWTFTWYSDRVHKRLIPILYGLAILLAGLSATIMLPTHAYALRYAALTVLLSGSFIASPLTVAWLSNNFPEPGKRAIVLGINGWGNLAGVFSAMLFSPKYEKQGYVTPFYVTTLCVLIAFIGYIVFRALMVLENRRRERIVGGWSNAEIEREALKGDMPLPGSENGTMERVKNTRLLNAFVQWAELDGCRRGDEKLTFRYSL